MTSTKKIKHFRRDHFSGPRRGQPRVQELNRAVRLRADQEHDLIQLLIADARLRHELLGGNRRPIDPLSVWTDFDQYRDYTQVAPERLPKWKDIGLFLKLHILFQAVNLWGAHSFTARIRPDLQYRWQRDGRDPRDRITRLISDEVAAAGLSNLAYAYVIEGRTRSGKSRTQLHIHGFLETADPMVATRFKVALEKAIGTHPKGKAAAGYSLKSGKPVKIEPSYDSGDPAQGTGGRWAGYIAKNATKPDKRVDNPVFISRAGSGLAREFWAFLREEPV